MHPLLTLYQLQGRSLLRRGKRSVRTVKGALLFFFGIVVVCLWLAPSAWQAMSMKRTDPREVLEVAPVIMLAMCLLSVMTSGGEKAVVFSPAEVDFLFPGPFTRRQLLAYKLGKSLLGISFSSLLLSVVLLRHARTWPQAWAGLFLATLFMQLLSMAITLIAQSAGERAYTHGRKVVLGIVIAAIALAAVPAMREGARPGFFQVAKSLHDSRLGRILLAPLAVFGHVLVAENWFPQALGWVAIALGINGVLLMIVFYLDADYLEAAATKSQAVYARMQRVRQGGIWAMSKPKKKGRLILPRPPFMRGAGPIAWRQGNTALRNARGLILLLVFLGLAVGPLLFASGNTKNIDRARAIDTGVLTAMAWMTLIAGGWLRFDFRGDLDLIDHLKSLPISAGAICVGQLITPTLMMTICHLAIIFSVMIAAHHADIFMISAVVISLPFNLLVFGVENVVFLLFPTRAAANPADFQGYGRQVLMVFAKGAVILMSAAIAGAAAGVIYLLTHSWPATIAAAVIVLSGIAIALIPMVTWAFKRFDVAGDVPA